MRKFLFLFLIPSLGFAQERYWCPDEPGTVRFPKPEGKECFDVSAVPLEKIEALIVIEKDGVRVAEIDKKIEKEIEDKKKADEEARKLKADACTAFTVALLNMTISERADSEAISTFARNFLGMFKNCR
jgi:hypothetical protein